MSRKKIVERRGSFSGGMLQGVVNAGRSAAKRLEWDKMLSEEERKRLEKIAADGRRAELDLEEHRKKFPVESDLTE